MLYLGGIVLKKFKLEDRAIIFVNPVATYAKAG